MKKLLLSGNTMYDEWQYLSLDQGLLFPFEIDEDVVRLICVL